MTEKIPSLLDAQNYIDHLDFKMIVKKMILEQNWDRYSAENCAQLYKNFLFLKKKFGEKYNIPPNKEIDQFWHNHILDTENYIKDCTAIFGHYLHHYPYAGLDGVTTYEQLKTYFNKVQELHYKEFGYYIYKIRLSTIDVIYQLVGLSYDKLNKLVTAIRGK